MDLNRLEQNSQITFPGSSRFKLCKFVKVKLYSPKHERLTVVSGNYRLLSCRARLIWPIQSRALTAHTFGPVFEDIVASGSGFEVSHRYEQSTYFFFIIAALMTVPLICPLINLSAAIYVRVNIKAGITDYTELALPKGKHWVFEQYPPLAVTEHTGVTELQVILVQLQQ
ncbi:hypothetical protein K439DRAFT_1522019 [Ramaria rubella]|nr:hypothetical protein K439DRAFT_1522019 [Ramaria rubella]